MYRKFVGINEWKKSFIDQRRRRRNKYNATRVTVDGRTYDSKREAAEANDLLLKLRTGMISKLEFQPEYELIPRPNRIVYRADFLVTYPDGHQEIIDVKGMQTPVFKLKLKMFRHFYPQLKLILVE